MEKKAATYQVIPRKYRPQTFASVVGQDAIVTTLKNALRFERLAHAYLFCGCRGTGKTTLARVFAKALNCQNLTENQEPCNACRSCLEVIGGRSLDVLEIDGASNRGIDDIRQINETIGYAPSSGKYKIYIVDEVHMLTKEAFNALLKTLEEPPANVKFFFATTEPHKILPTIISRCQRFDLNRISPETMQAKLSFITQDLHVPCAPEALALISHLSEGCLRDAESLLDQVICYSEPPITLEKVSATLGLMPRASFFDLDQAIATYSLSYAFELTQSVFSSGKDLGHFLDNLVEHFRTHLHIKLGRTPHVINEDEKKRYLEASVQYTEDQCLAILDYLIHWQQQMLKTPFKRIGLEMILLHLIRSKHRISLSTLTRRLVELEQTAKAHLEPIRKEIPVDAQPQVSNVELPTKADLEPIRKEIPVQTQPQVSNVAPPAKAHLEPIRKEIPVVGQPQVSNVEPPAKADVEPIRKEIPIQQKPQNLNVEPPPSIEPEAALEEQTIHSPLCNDPKSPSIEETLLNKMREKIESAAVETPKIIPPIEPARSENRPPLTPSSRHETLVRFAAVELEGIVKK